jgi:hypothetical protein
MCLQCVEAVKEVFPDVPDEEYGDFLMGTTCFPFGDAEVVRMQLLKHKSRTDDYKDCYGLAEKDMMDSVIRNMTT